jgi:proteasome assembly chaperone (PAC2) family protein
MSQTIHYGQEVPYAIAEIIEDLPETDDMITVVCTGTGIGLVGFMTGYHLLKQDLKFTDLGEISSLSMLSDPIVDEDTGYFESPGIKLRYLETGTKPMFFAFGPRQPAAWEAHFAGKALFDVIERISPKTMMLSVGGFGVTSMEKMPEIVGRPNNPESENFMNANGIAKMDEIQEVEGIAKILNAGQGFQAALPMLAKKRGIPAVFFLGTTVMPEHMGVRLDIEAVRHVISKIADLAGIDIDYDRIKEETQSSVSQERGQQSAIYELAKRFSQSSQASQPDKPNRDMYI